MRVLVQDEWLNSFIKISFHSGKGQLGVKRSSIQERIKKMHFQHLRKTE